MGTNYYARIIPTKERKEEIKNAINNDDFYEIKRLVDITYLEPSYNHEIDSYVGGEIHLGKRSTGWKFLWNPNWYKIPKGHMEWIDNGKGEKTGHWVDDGYDVFKYYDLTKKSLKEFIDREDVVIYDEYDIKQEDKEEFWRMALSWGKFDGWDGDSYEEWESKQNPSYHPRIYRTEYSDFIRECGFTLNKYEMDFYSDKLRFSTSTKFS